MEKQMSDLHLSAGTQSPPAVRLQSSRMNPPPSNISLAASQRTDLIRGVNVYDWRRGYCGCSSPARINVYITGRCLSTLDLFNVQADVSSFFYFFILLGIIEAHQIFPTFYFYYLNCRQMVNSSNHSFIIVCYPLLQIAISAIHPLSIV